MKWDKVEVKTEQVVDENPETWIKSATKDIDEDNYDSALRKLKQAREFAKGNPIILAWTYSMEVVCYFAQGNTSAARESSRLYREYGSSVKDASGISYFQATVKYPTTAYVCMRVNPYDDFWYRIFIDSIDHALKNQDYAAIEDLLNVVANVNATTASISFIHKRLAEHADNDFAFAVIRDGKLNLLEALRNGGFNLAACKDSGGKNLTMAAVNSSNYSEEILQFLLKHRINYIDEKDNDGWTALMHCASYSDAMSRGLKQLIRAGADVNAKNKQNQTVLMKAVEYGDIDKGQLLIDSGANIFLKDNDGFDALYYACSGFIKFLVKHGANINHCYEKFPGGTLLHHAAKCYWRNSYRHYWQTVLDLSADVNVKDDSGLTPLVYALDHEFILTAELDFPRALVKRGAVIDADVRAVLRRRGIKENNLHNNSTNFFFSKWF